MTQKFEFRHVKNTKIIVKLTGPNDVEAAFQKGTYNPHGDEPRSTYDKIASEVISRPFLMQLDQCRTEKGQRTSYKDFGWSSNSRHRAVSNGTGDGFRGELMKMSSSQLGFLYQRTSSTLR